MLCVLIVGRKMTKHDSMRGWFAYELYQHMKENKDIVLIVGDLGYKVFDAHFADFPDRCINTGAAEQAMMGIACGLAMEGKIPFVYSITPFLLYRPFETIRTYINHEKIPVRLVGSGRDKDYHIDGYSHDATDADDILKTMRNINELWPMSKEQIPAMVKQMVLDDTRPYFISLKR